MTAEDLRNSILEYAIQGNLVPQKKEEGLSSDSLSKIIETRKEQIAERGKSSSYLDLSFIRENGGTYVEVFPNGDELCVDEEIPFSIPENWSWVRLRLVAEIARGGSPRPIKSYLTDDPNGINWIKIGDTEKNGKYINSTAERIIPEGVKRSRMIHKGDFLLTNSMSFGRPYISNVDGCIHDGWLVISPLEGSYYPDFLYYLLSSKFAYNQFCGKVSGAVVKNLNTEKVLNAVFPIPPYEEQKRIVAKIEQLFTLVEKYSKLSERLSEIDDALIDNLFNSVLQYAMQGNFSLPSLQTSKVEMLFEEIYERKRSLVEAGVLKKKDLTKLSIDKNEEGEYIESCGNKKVNISEDINFDIPSHWKWTRLGYIANLYTGNSINETEKVKKYTNVTGVDYIGTKDVNFDHTIHYENGVNIPDEFLSNFRQAPDNSILLCIEGGSAGRKLAITNKTVCFGNKLCCFVSYAPIYKYIYYYLQSPLFRNVFSTNKNGIIGGVSLNVLKNLLIPLPPKEEMDKIVNIIETSLKVLGRT